MGDETARPDSRPSALPVAVGSHPPPAGWRGLLTPLWARVSAAASSSRGRAGAAPCGSDAAEPVPCRAVLELQCRLGRLCPRVCGHETGSVTHMCHGGHLAPQPTGETPEPCSAVTLSREPTRACPAPRPVRVAVPFGRGRSLQLRFGLSSSRGLGRVSEVSCPSARSACLLGTRGRAGPLSRSCRGRSPPPDAEAAPRGHGSFLSPAPAVCQRHGAARSAGGHPPSALRGCRLAPLGLAAVPASPPTRLTEGSAWGSPSAGCRARCHLSLYMRPVSERAFQEGPCVRGSQRVGLCAPPRRRALLLLLL